MFFNISVDAAVYKVCNRTGRMGEAVCFTKE